jgi:hypothetical protein
MRHRNEEGGELVVSGEDKVRIPLLAYPHRVEVTFKHKHHPPPCDQPDPHYDQLEWEVHNNYYGPHRFTLIIKWKVFDLREIIWTAYY